MTKKKLEPLSEFGQTAPASARSAARPALPFDHGHVQIQESQQGASQPTPADQAANMVQLLWVDSSVGARLRRQRAWRAIVDAMSDDDDLEVAESLAGAPGEDVDAARNAFEILAQATPSATDTLRTVLREAVRPDGKLVAPLIMVSGTLVLSLSPQRRLATTFALAGPLTAAHEELQQSMAALQPYVDNPDAIAGGADTLTQQLIQTLRSKLQSLPKGHLEATVERMLLLERDYERRVVFGEPHVRALLAGEIPAYLSEAAANELPLAANVGVRLIVEIHPRVDDAETHPCALRVRALARELAIAAL